MSGQVKPASEQKPRFECWSTNEGDSWHEHPADAELLYDVLGNSPKVGDEFEVMAGWCSVQARYRIVSQKDDDFEVECISHPEDNTAPQPDYRAQRDALLKCLALIEPKLDFSGWENGQGEDIGNEINAVITSVKGGA